MALVRIQCQSLRCWLGRLRSGVTPGTDAHANDDDARSAPTACAKSDAVGLGRAATTPATAGCCGVDAARVIRLWIPSIGTAAGSAYSSQPSKDAAAAPTTSVAIGS